MCAREHDECTESLRQSQREMEELRADLLMAKEKELVLSGQLATSRFQLRSALHSARNEPGSSVPSIDASICLAEAEHDANYMEHVEAEHQRKALQVSVEKKKDETLFFLLCACFDCCGQCKHGNDD